MTTRHPDRFDQLIAAGDRALRTLAAEPHSSREYPPALKGVSDANPLSARERREAAALMRVNHVGEVCAQALYDAQALAARSPELRAAFVRAAHEETDHLAWTQRRITELGGRTSLLNPLWYSGSFAIGLVAARLGDRASLGFMAETERQVEHHLQSHLQSLPQADAASRAIVEQMKADEARHGLEAWQQGARALPAPVTGLMRLMSRLMTTVAYRI